MRTLNIDLFKANELPAYAMTRALNDYREINLDKDTWFNTYQDEAEILGIILGREDIEGFTDELSEVVTKILDSYPPGSAGFAIGKKYESIFTFGYIADEETEFKKDLYGYYMGNIDRVFTEKYDVLTSDEAVLLTLVNNNYEFTNNGILYTVITNEEWIEVENAGPRVSILQI